MSEKSEEKEVLKGVSKVRVSFHPQVWQNDYARPADPKGKTKFTVPLSDATDEDGNLLEDDTYESDVLKDHENAPGWIQNWEGPFYITINELL